jgi:hypothetical protein
MRIFKKRVLLGLALLTSCIYAQNYSVERGQFYSASGYSESDSFSEYSVIGGTESGTSSNSEFQLESGAVLLSSGSLTEIDSGMLLPLSFSIQDNFPNPFNARTHIMFTIPELQTTVVEIFDCNGRVVRTLIHQPLNAGQYFLEWDGFDDAGLELSSGLYLTRIQTGYHSDVIKMLLLK